MPIVADAVPSAIVGDSGIVKGVKMGQMCQKVTGEPGERLGVANGAERHFEIAASPGTFETPPRRREAFAQVGRAFALPPYFVPECGKERFVAPVAQPSLNALGKSLEEGPIHDGSLFVGRLAGPTVERRAADVRRIG